MKKKIIIPISFVVIIILAFLSYLLVFLNKNITLVNNDSKEYSIKLKSKKEENIKITVNNTSGDKLNADIIFDSNVNASDYIIYILKDGKKIIDKGIIDKENTIIGNVLLNENESSKYNVTFIYNSNKERSKINLKGSIFLKKHEDYVTSTLISGSNLNSKMLKLANPDVDDVKSDTNIHSIKVVNEIDDKYKIKDNIVSTDESTEAIYMWYSDNIIYLYCKNKIAFNQRSNSLFSKLEMLSDINDLKYIDSSYVITFASMFYGDVNLNDISALSHFKTDDLSDMTAMFYNCSSLKDITPLVAFNTSSLKSLSQTFEDTSVEDISILKYFNTSKLQDLDFAFTNTKIKDLSPLKDWNTDNLEKLTYTFAKTKIGNVNALSNWDVSHVRNLNSTFAYCINLNNIDGLSNWKTSSLEEMENTFSYTKIENVDALANFDTKNLTNIKRIFSSARKLNNIKGLKNWNISKVSSLKDCFYKTSFTNTDALKKWNTSNISDMSGTFSHTKIVDIDGLSNWDVSNVKKFHEMFNNTHIVDLDAFLKWDVSKGEDFSYMFSYSTKLKNTSGIDKWNISSGEDFSYMFSNSSVELPKWNNGNWDSDRGFNKS